MVLKQNNTKEASAELTSSSKRRRNRRKTLHKSKNSEESADINECSTQNLSDLVPNNKITTNSCQEDPADTVLADGKQNTQQNSTEIVNSFKQHSEQESKMSSKDSTKSRDDVLAAREAKKLAKQKTKGKDGATAEKVDTNKEKVSKEIPLKQEKQSEKVSAKCVDEVDRASIQEPAIASKSIVSDDQKSKDQVLAERAAKKAAKQAKKKGTEENLKPNPDMTVKDVVQTLKDIKNVAKDVQDLTAKVSAIHIEATKQTPSIEAKVNIQNDALNTEEGKSKAELKAERRAKQEAQRAAKQAAVDQKAAQAKALAAKDKPAEVKKAGDIVKEKSPKPKTDKSVKPVSASANRVNWFQHLYPEHDKEALKNIALNSNLHPAIIKLGVQLASRVVTGANARCIALFDALKKMLKDYTLPAKTEFARGFEPHLASSLDFLWAMRQPSASQTNAVKFFRHHLNQLPNNIDEFDAKKILQQEIDHYIEDQIDKAGEAISMTVQKKISTGDNILTYGCSSLIERCLREAWQAGLKFRTVIVGDRVNRAGQEMLRRLTAAGLPCIYVDMTAISYIMKSVNKVLLGAGSLLVNGCVVGLAGTAQTALAARDHNVPVLVACETHKFSDRVQTDAFVYNELGDPDALIDKSDENSPLKDWRSNPNLTPLNLTYDVTPPSLVTAVVTEKAILPCTSAPVVLRTKLTEYGM